MYTHHPEMDVRKIQGCDFAWESWGANKNPEY